MQNIHEKNWKFYDSKFCLDRNASIIGKSWLSNFWKSHWIYLEICLRPDQPEMARFHFLTSSWWQKIWCYDDNDEGVDDDDDDYDDENKPEQQQTAGQGLICCTSRHRQKLGNNLCDKYEDEDTEDYDHDLVFYIFIIFKLGNTFHIKYDDEDDDEIDEYDE